ncbi:hypothetical protein DL764_005545 [Monosporascus ibericus]|uniref:C2H2-type domain-containing protein n=1 Tax=Monosporascus ibericus TaxID=155417 RepID=A0A4V1XAI7_9PEZI|nr:hypothetical protein DL764_005545 [Monosporascus ibericus]
MADAGSPTTEQSPQTQHHESRPESSHNASNGPPRSALPPTPPMGVDACFEGYNSPSSKSDSQVPVVPGPTYYYETTPPVEEIARQTMTNAPVARIPLQASAYTQPQFATPYIRQPSMGPYYQSSMQAVSPAQSQISALYYQRPLPQTFPPAAPVNVSLAPSSGANPWQHHHYISPSSAASFPQSQDRYICQTCNKAFSRPSSLRIHSHSHTGEKPFKCPHIGCGKAFSVRSNMKRHERGCHSSDDDNSFR